MDVSYTIPTPTCYLVWIQYTHNFCIHLSFQVIHLALIYCQVPFTGVRVMESELDLEDKQ